MLLTADGDPTEATEVVEAAEAEIDRKEKVEMMRRKMLMMRARTK